eukprot:COSAG04_NODE_2513_length_3987_cov_11.345165_1_plen_279_part_10
MTQQQTRKAHMARLGEMEKKLAAFRTAVVARQGAEVQQLWADWQVKEAGLVRVAEEAEAAAATATERAATARRMYESAQEKSAKRQKDKAAINKTLSIQAAVIASRDKALLKEQHALKAEAERLQTELEQSTRRPSPSNPTAATHRAVVHVPPPPRPPFSGGGCGCAGVEVLTAQAQAAEDLRHRTARDPAAAGAPARHRICPCAAASNQPCAAGPATLLSSVLPVAAGPVDESERNASIPSTISVRASVCHSLTLGRSDQPSLTRSRRTLAPRKPGQR